jgi:hypothetical protein
MLRLLDHYYFQQPNNIFITSKYSPHKLIKSTSCSSVFHYMSRPYLLTIIRCNTATEGKVLQKKNVYGLCVMSAWTAS